MRPPVAVNGTDRKPVEPLDPDSPKARELAARLSVTFAEIEDAIAARKAREAAKTAEHP